jgi:hypothetical protein
MGAFCVLLVYQKLGKKAHDLYAWKDITPITNRQIMNTAFPKAIVS